MGCFFDELQGGQIDKTCIITRLSSKRRDTEKKMSRIQKFQNKLKDLSNKVDDYLLDLQVIEELFKYKINPANTFSFEK